MQLRCKPGDLAMIISASGGAGWHGDVAKAVIGYVVRVVKLRPRSNDACTAPLVWEFERSIAVSVGGRTALVLGCADNVLRPLRDDDADDEMLRIAGLPNETPADLIRSEQASSVGARDLAKRTERKETPQRWLTEVRPRDEVMELEACESATGRGNNVAPALAIAPTRSPSVGSMGARQAADAAARGGSMR